MLQFSKLPDSSPHFSNDVFSYITTSLTCLKYNFLFATYSSLPRPLQHSYGNTHFLLISFSRTIFKFFLTYPNSTYLSRPAQISPPMFYLYFSEVILTRTNNLLLWRSSLLSSNVRLSLLILHINLTNVTVNTAFFLCDLLLHSLT